MRYSEISDFFRQYRYVERSAVLGIGNDGRKNGYGAILFESSDEAHAAAEELDQQNIGSRYVELSVISYGDYLAFNGPASGGGGGFQQNQGNQKTTQLSNFVNEDNQTLGLVMRGLPYRIEVQEIIDFFADAAAVQEDNIHIEERFGKRSGSALVFFESQETAQNVKSTLNKKEIGKDGRYVELLDSNDAFMRKICRLPME